MAILFPSSANKSAPDLGSGDQTDSFSQQSHYNGVNESEDIRNEVSLHNLHVKPDGCGWLYLQTKRVNKTFF